MSSKGYVIPRGMVAVRERQRMPADGQVTGTMEVPRLVLADDLNRIQAAAIQKAQSVSRDQATALFSDSIRVLDQEARTLAAARAEDRKVLAEFAVRLSCLIAEELVATLIQADAHDLRGMVTRVLDQVLPELGEDKVILQVNPDDLSLVSNEFLREIGASSVRVVPNPSLPRAGLRVVGAAAEFYSSLNDRLNAMREALLADLNGGSDAGP